MTTPEIEEPTRWPIVPHRTGHALNDRRTGRRISWHRTISGALRARRALIEERDGVNLKSE